jgi:hypothetical protein
VEKVALKLGLHTYEFFKTFKNAAQSSPWRRGPEVSSPPATKEMRVMDSEIESRQGICRVVAFKNC